LARLAHPPYWVVPILQAHFNICDALKRVEVVALVAPNAIRGAVAGTASSGAGQTDPRSVRIGGEPTVVAFPRRGQVANLAAQTDRLRGASFTRQHARRARRSHKFIIEGISWENAGALSDA
jgi:hypothetical protein